MADLKQNLSDAGCCSKFISDFLNNCNNKEKQLEMLCCYRKSILKKLHACQKQLDCLDYLAYMLKKKDDE